MKSRIFQAILLIVLFVVGAVLFLSIKSNESTPQDQYELPANP